MPRSVYLFGTCLIDVFHPQAGLAAIRLLEREGIGVIYPQGQTCCGQPAFNSGYPTDARTVARAQMQFFPGGLPIVVPSGSCAAMMRHHYPALFEQEADRDQAVAFAARVHELTDFLATEVGVTFRDRGEPVKVAWHASCHAAREMGIVDQPKGLLRQLANVELHELARERECCGFGGTFAVRFPEISKAMVVDKASDIESTQASEVLSADCGCLMNISRELHARHSKVRARHIAEFLWERTRER